MPLNGSSVKTEDFTAKLQGILSASDAADAAKAVWVAKLAAAREQSAAAEPDIVAAHSYVLAVFGAKSTTLADFGLPRRSTARTLAAKQQAVAKSLATRDARHTMGPRQKAAIHGTVPTAPAPAAPAPVAPASSTAAPAPAPVAGKAGLGGNSAS